MSNISFGGNPQQTAAAAGVDVAIHEANKKDGK